MVTMFIAIFWVSVLSLLAVIAFKEVAEATHLQKLRTMFVERKYMIHLLMFIMIFIGIIFPQWLYS